MGSRKFLGVLASTGVAAGVGYSKVALAESQERKAIKLWNDQADATQRNNMARITEESRLRTEGDLSVRKAEAGYRKEEASALADTRAGEQADEIWARQDAAKLAQASAERTAGLTDSGVIDEKTRSPIPTGIVAEYIRSNPDLTPAQVMKKYGLIGKPEKAATKESSPSAVIEADLYGRNYADQTNYEYKQKNGVGMPTEMYKQKYREGFGASLDKSAGKQGVSDTSAQGILDAMSEDDRKLTENRASIAGVPVLAMIALENQPLADPGVGASKETKDNRTRFISRLTPENAPLIVSDPKATKEQRSLAEAFIKNLPRVAPKDIPGKGIAYKAGRVAAGSAGVAKKALGEAGALLTDVTTGTSSSKTMKGAKAGASEFISGVLGR